MNTSAENSTPFLHYKQYQQEDQPWNKEMLTDKAVYFFESSDKEILATEVIGYDS